MNLQIEELKARHTIRERERAIQRHDVLAMARIARCRSHGCHPVVERVSRLLVTAATQLNAWAAPSHRQVRLDLGGDSTPASVA
ncbi:MAG TPA: hypothetical protein VGR08_06910 [Thermomicrobiales bacterium]|nr:hypothetical protein [Thermomicrobiales bacterium]